MQARYYLSGHNGGDPRFGAIAFMIAGYPGALFGASADWNWAGDWEKLLGAPWTGKALGTPGPPRMLDPAGCAWNRTFASGASAFVNLCFGKGHPKEAHVIWADGTTWPARSARSDTGRLLANLAASAAAGGIAALPTARFHLRAVRDGGYACRLGHESVILGPDGGEQCLSLADRKL